MNRQYQSVFTTDTKYTSVVFTHEDPDTTIPDPDGDPFPTMNQFTVSEEGVRKLLQKSNPWKASGPDMIPARLLKEYFYNIHLLIVIFISYSCLFSLIFHLSSVTIIS